jgi:GT2 family glycosyltransferase
VDIVVGCFFLIRTELWRALGGFDPRYWMYGEEADLCLRARALGARPVITPEATIMHLIGASAGARVDKTVMVAKARATLMARHWPVAWRPTGRALLWLWAALRRAASVALPGRRFGAARALWAGVWAQRRDWLAGYPAAAR